MVNFDRPFSAFSFRLQAIAAGAALAFITGLSAPAAASVGAAASGNDAAPTVENVAMVRAAEANSSATTAEKAVADQASADKASADRAAQAIAAQPVANVLADQAAAVAAAPTIAQLHTAGIQGAQVSTTLSAAQMKNAQAIIQAGQSMGLPPRAWVIALATSLQETKLNNYGDLGASNDHDSLGLFQQRPTSGWGSPAELQNPNYAAKAFYKALTQVPNWDKIPLTEAAQTVQVSAFGDRYAQWEAHAADIVMAFYGQGPLASTAKQVM